MSNKTQLQTNNTKLASLIQTLQGKATGGSGGSGDATAETCTVTIYTYQMQVCIICVTMENGAIVLLDDYTSSASNDSTQYKVVKGTTLIFYDPENYFSGVPSTVSGNITQLTDSYWYRRFQITGDGTIDFAP